MTSIQIKDKKFDLFIKESDIIESITALAKQISKDLHGKDPLFVCVLNGAFMFAADLMKQVDIPCEITFIRLKSYQGIHSAGDIKEIQGLCENIENRHIVIIEDIIDTGYTMKHLLSLIGKQLPASIKIATLLFKPEALKTDIKPDYVAMEISNDFIVGYGLDYDGFGRNLKNIYKINLC
jgi:hypoxanthine phosphoribosyltransferase